MSVHHFTGLLDDSCNAVSVFGEASVLEDLWIMHVYGFAPVRKTDEAGDVIAAFHESLKTVLLLINSAAYTDYLCIRLGDLMHAQEQQQHRDLNQSTAITDEAIIRPELERLRSFVGTDGNRLFPAFRLGVLRAVKGEAALSVSATIHHFEPAVHTIWLLNIVSESSDEREHSTWRAFSKCTAVLYEDIVELMYRPSYPTYALSAPTIHVAANQDLVIRSASQQPTCLQTRTSAMEAQQLLSLEPGKVMGAILLKIAEHYSNTDICNEVNRRWPGQAFNSLSVLTKRLTAAIETESARTGRPSNKIRLDLAAVREDNGVKNRARLIKSL